MLSNKISQMNSTRTINNKFGTFEIDASQSILFPYGILGMPAQKHFCILPCHIEKFSQFVLMQSAMDDNLVFMALPIDINSPIIIKQEDLVNAGNSIGVEAQNMAVLLIAATKETESGRRITVNAKAPIIVDSVNRFATQIVMHDTEYEIQHLL